MKKASSILVLALLVAGFVTGFNVDRVSAKFASSPYLGPIKNFQPTTTTSVSLGDICTLQRSNSFSINCENSHSVVYHTLFGDFQAGASCTVYRDEDQDGHGDVRALEISPTDRMYATYATKVCLNDRKSPGYAWQADDSDDSDPTIW